MTLVDKNCFHCNKHYQTGDDPTIEDNELCPSCDNQGMLLDCPTCDMPYYASDDAQVPYCRTCYVRNNGKIVVPDVLLVVGQGHILLDAFGERTEEVYTSKDELFTSLRGFREVLESESDYHVDIVYDTAHPIGGIRPYYVEEDFHVERLMADVYNVVNNMYEELTVPWIVRKL